MRTNFRFIARAIDWPSEVLPTPGGPTKQRIGPLIRVGGLAAPPPALGPAFGPPALGLAVPPSPAGFGGAGAPPARWRGRLLFWVLSFCTARYSTMRSLTLSRS